jgi:NAD(P)-dependent dehydrogenase (short-subunit alcohol dehydrogenase family)
MKLDPWVADLFSLRGKVVIITGGAGLLGLKHAEVVAGAGGRPVLLDVAKGPLDQAVRQLKKSGATKTLGFQADITQDADLEKIRDILLKKFGKIDVLINNAARNPKVEAPQKAKFSRVENFPLDQWEEDLSVGLKGAFLCSKIFGGVMAKNGSGVILNISSEYGMQAPDQRLYRVPGLPEARQPVKPVTYTVVKSGLLGLTKYFATYWGTQQVRVNAITIGGVQTAQPRDFIKRYVQQVPLGRMAKSDEYQGTVLFLCTAASRFMTGANVVVDGGKSCW